LDDDSVESVRITSEGLGDWKTGGLEDDSVESELQVKDWGIGRLEDWKMIQLSQNYK
jgi:hypothetical protein